MEKILRRSLLVLLLLAPLCSPERLPLLNAVYPAALILLLAIFAVFWRVLKKNLLVSANFAIALFIYSSVVLFSGFLSENPALNIFDLKIVFLAFLLVVTANAFRTQKDREYAVFAVMCGAVLTAIFAFYQKYIGMADLAKFISVPGSAIGDPQIHAEVIKNISNGRVFSTFVNSNVYAGFLAMVIPVALGLFLVNYKNMLLRVVTGACFLALLYALFLTRSAGGMVTAAASLIIFLLFVVKEKSRLIFICLALTAVFALFIVLLRADIFNFVNKDNSILNRLGYFKEALNIFMKNPVLGNGAGSYALLAKDGIRFPHNWYLQVLAENGLLGFGVLAAFLGLMLKESTGLLLRLKGRERVIFAGVFAGFIGFLVHNLFDVDSNYWQNCFVAFFFAGLMASMFKYKLKNYFMLLFTLALAGAILFARQQYVHVPLLLFAVISSVLFLKVYFDRKIFVKTSLDVPLLLLVLLAVISVIFSVNRFVTLQGVCLILSCSLLFYSTVNSIKKEENFAPVPLLLAWFCLILSLAGIAEYFYNGGQRSFGLFPNPNMLGGFLASGTGFLLFYFYKAQGRAGWFFGLTLILSLVCLHLTKSRGGFLVAVCSIVLFLVLLGVLARKNAVSGKKRIYVTVSLIVFLAIAVTPLNPVVKRALELGKNDKAAYSRIEIWGSALKMLKDRPLAGFGLNTFKDAAPKYYFPVGGSIGNYTRVQHHAHNEYLQFLVETGVAGGLLMLVFLYLIIRRFFRILAATKDKEKLFALCAVATAIAGLLIHALVDFNLHFLPTLVLLVLLTGILFSKYLSEKQFHVIDEKKKYFFHGAVAVTVAGVLVLAGMNFFSVYYFGKRAATAELLDKNLRLSLFFNPYNSDSMAELGKLYRYHLMINKEQKYLAQSEECFKLAQKNNPLNAHYHKHLGLLYYAAGLKEEVYREYEMAVKLNPCDVFLKFELAYIYAEKGGYEPALRYAKEAVSLEPNFVGAHLLLSGIYFKLNDQMASDAEKGLAYEINAKYKDAAVIDYEKMLVSLGERR